jgi:psp operon transcriptional activator
LRCHQYGGVAKKTKCCKKRLHQGKMPQCRTEKGTYVMTSYSEEQTESTVTELHEELGQSDAFLAFQERLSRVAGVDRPVLIIGERGTGKELAAKRVHYLSRRWQEPLVELNCAALTPTLIESELFGHETGAFTGATTRRKGRFEAAHEGTLLLDELGNVPLQVQEKILRVVEYGAFERVGGQEAIRVNVRIVGATNADLMGLADEGRFMRDLLDRLSFEVLYAPPLRARQEDIMLLSNHFAARMAFELGRQDLPEFTDDVINQLESYAWPGNVRELKNVVERAVYLAEGDTIKDIVFDPFQSPFHAIRLPSRHEESNEMDSQPVATAVPAPANLPVLDRSFKDAISEYERLLLNTALQQAQFNQRKAAKLLDLTYHQFRGLYRKYADSEEE